MVLMKNCTSPIPQHSYQPVGEIKPARASESHSPATIYQCKCGKTITVETVKYGDVIR